MWIQFIGFFFSLKPNHVFDTHCNNFKHDIDKHSTLEVEGTTPFKYVNTSLGQLQGRLDPFFMGPSYYFTGIPYAKPPVGDLRFKKPQPVEPWSGTIGQKMPPACIQYSQHPYPWYDQEPDKSEDCLYINVRMPALTLGPSNINPAVLVFIHGGGFSYGSNRMPIYNGVVYGADIGGVAGGQGTFFDGSIGFVVVTVNYRLGALGFLTSQTENAPGNVGEYIVHGVLS